MRRVTLQSLLGPALLLYLVADAAAAQGQIDPVGVLCALLAAALTLTPRILVHDLGAQGARAVSLLGLALAIALVRAIAPAALSIVGDVAHVIALGATAALLSVLSSQDGPMSRGKQRGIAALIFVVGAGSGLLATLPPPVIAGVSVIVPARWSSGPLLVLGATVVAAFSVRVVRLRRGSPSAQAAQAWALLGLTPAMTALGLVALSALSALSDAIARPASAIAALLLVWGHAAALDPDRRLLAGPVARRAASFLLVLTCVWIALRTLELMLTPFALELPLPTLLAVALGLAALLRKPADHGAMSLLAPAQGRLLRAIERAHAAIGQASDLNSLAQHALSALRQAATSDASRQPPESARVLLYRIAPPCEMHLDAAGLPFLEPRPLHPEIERALRKDLGAILVRATLEAKIVREPPLRPLIAALVDLDALCAVPLIHDGELEGALVLPRCGRARALTLEELSALEDLGRHMAAFLSVLASDARAQERAEQAFIEARLCEAQAAEATEQQARLRHELRALHALPRQAALEVKPIAYSDAMRALLGQLDELSTRDLPLWLSAERGVEVEPLARYVHERSPRAQAPLLTIACASLSHDEAPALLERVVQAADGGSVLLLDAAALPAEAQRAIGELAKAATSKAGTARVRVFCSARTAPSALVQRGALVTELAERFVRVLEVPPLRARKQDLPSLILLALDQCSRVLGKPTVGIDAAAQARLLAYAFPFNTTELLALVERAVQACAGPRIGAAEISSALGLSPSEVREELSLDGTFERVERRVLRRALDRTSGNKSEAARLLGLPRTTFIDKLRRHGLDDRGGSTPPLRSAG